jgi:sortase (surface protein transpeptidase)
MSTEQIAPPRAPRPADPFAEILAGISALRLSTVVRIAELDREVHGAQRQGVAAPARPDLLLPGDGRPTGRDVAPPSEAATPPSAPPPDIRLLGDDPLERRVDVRADVTAEAAASARPVIPATTAQAHRVAAAAVPFVAAPRALTTAIVRGVARTGASLRQLAALIAGKARTLLSAIRRLPGSAARLLQDLPRPALRLLPLRRPNLAAVRRRAAFVVLGGLRTASTALVSARRSGTSSIRHLSHRGAGWTSAASVVVVSRVARAGTRVTSLPRPTLRLPALRLPEHFRLSRAATVRLLAVVAVVAVTATVAVLARDSDGGAPMSAFGQQDAPDLNAAVAPVVPPPTPQPESVPVAPEELRRPPLLLRIPAIDIAAATVPVGLEVDGSMEIPSDVSTIGWYEPQSGLGVTPGQTGTAVLAGHVDSRTQGPGAFYFLRDLNVGDIIEIDHADGTTSAWFITDITQYPKDDLPITEVFVWTGPPRLALITCGGPFDWTARSYTDNLVVYAEPVTASNAGAASGPPPSTAPTRGLPR